MKMIQRLPKALFFLFFLSTAFAINANAQTRKEKEAAKAEAVKNLVEGQRYVFIAQTVLPMGGRSRQITPDFDFTVTKDTIISYLPYFGRAYNVPLPNEGGVKFTSTDFEYTKTDGKKGGWDILIKPKDNRDIQQVRINITESGYAFLQVTSNNRQPISYNGFIQEKVERRKKK